MHVCIALIIKNIYKHILYIVIKNADVGFLRKLLVSLAAYYYIDQ